MIARLNLIVAFALVYIWVVLYIAIYFGNKISSNLNPMLYFKNIQHIRYLMVTI